MSPEDSDTDLPRLSGSYTPLLTKEIPLKEKIGVSLFLVPFFLGGLVGFYLLTARPLWRTFLARGWVETTCVIESAATRVVTHATDDADTYVYDMRYGYEYRGARYSSDRYGFGAFNRGLTAGGLTRDGLARYPKGSRTACYVDPERPAQAVLDRGEPKGWGYGLFPLLATGFAGFLLAFTFRN